MSSLRKYIRSLLKEDLLSEDEMANIQPNDIVTVYHGASATDLPMIRGIDATQVKTRSYGGPKHEGIFVSPNPELARRFSSGGQLVLEIKTLAKNLYGTDYSGNTSEKQVAKGERDPNEIFRDRYPNSFRPYLSATMLQSSEPQALLVGTVRPEQITRVQWKGDWHDRDEFLKSSPEYHKPYESKPSKLKKLGFDPTDGSISFEQMVSIISQQENMEQERVKKTLLRVSAARPDDMAHTFEQMGWVRSAAQQMVKNIQAAT